MKVQEEIVVVIERGYALLPPPGPDSEIRKGGMGFVDLPPGESRAGGKRSVVFCSKGPCRKEEEGYETQEVEDSSVQIESRTVQSDEQVLSMSGRRDEDDRYEASIVRSL